MPNNSTTTNNLPGSKEYITNLFTVLSKLTARQLMLLYGDLFTESEAVMLAKRLEIARGLLTGKSYTQIQKQLGVTANTVAQIQKVLKNAGTGFRDAVKFLASLEESKFVVRPLVVPSKQNTTESINLTQDKTVKSVFKKFFHSGA